MRIPINQLVHSLESSRPFFLTVAHFACLLGLAKTHRHLSYGDPGFYNEIPGEQYSALVGTSLVFLIFFCEGLQ